MRFNGDARDLHFLAPGSVACVVTSPPYQGLADYESGDDREIGRGSLDEYIHDMLAVGEELHRVTDDRAVWWLNIGDSFAGSGGAGGDYNRGGKRDGIAKFRPGSSGLPGPQQILVPHRVALALQAEGWLVRKWITWDQGGVLPEDPRHVRRPLRQSEVIIMLTKGRDHRWNPEAQRSIGLGDVWVFPRERSREKRGLRAFPPELPRRCIMLSTEPGDVVLDPFGGSGTTVAVAESLDRIGWDVELKDRVEPVQKG